MKLEKDTKIWLHDELSWWWSNFEEEDFDTEEEFEKWDKDTDKILIKINKDKRLTQKELEDVFFALYQKLDKD